MEPTPDDHTTVEPLLHQRPKRRSSLLRTLIAETLGASNQETRTKFENIIALRSPEELNGDYVNVYSTCSLVGGLLMSFLGPEAGSRTDVSQVQFFNIWGSYSKWVVEADQMIIVCCFFMAFVMMFLAVVMLTQLAHIPKKQTRLLFLKLGDAKIHAPLAHIQKLLAMYGFHFLLQTSLNYHFVTTIVAGVITLSAIGWGIYSATNVIATKTRTLEVIREQVAMTTVAERAAE